MFEGRHCPSGHPALQHDLSVACGAQDDSGDGGRHAGTQD